MLLLIPALLILLQPVSSQFQIVVVRNLDTLTDKLDILIELQRNNSMLTVEKRDVLATLLRQQNYQDNLMMDAIAKLADEVSAIRQKLDQWCSHAEVKTCEKSSNTTEVSIETSSVAVESTTSLNETLVEAVELPETTTTASTESNESTKSSTTPAV